MKHKVLQPIQRKWIGWLLVDGREWMNFHIIAESNYQLLNWSWINGIYDVSTGQLLNFLLNRFNKGEEIKRCWQLNLKCDNTN